MGTRRIVMALGGSVLLLACGKPTWPTCETDAHCADQDGVARGFVCFDRTCVECIDDAQCAGRAPATTCDLGSRRCVEPVAAATTPACSVDADCPAGQACNGGLCIPAAEAAPILAGAADPYALFRSLGLEQCIPPAYRGANARASGPATVETQVIRFDFDRSAIRPDMRAALDHNARCLKQLQTLQLQVEGHADERGTTEYNLALGQQRAETVATYLQRAGLPADRVRTISKGEGQPLCRRADETCWATNRRVELLQR